MLDLAQKNISLGQSLGRGLRHQASFGQARQRAEGRSRSQLRKLAATHHLQQLHGELDLANATTRELDVIGSLRVARAAPQRMLADLSVQHAQCVKHPVVEVAPEHKRQDHAAQAQDIAAGYVSQSGNDTAFQPGKALPLPALDMQVLFQPAQRDGRWARVAIGPQGQVDPEHEAVFGGVANQAVQGANGAAKVLLVTETATSLVITGGLTVLVIDINEVDVA